MVNMPISANGGHVPSLRDEVQPSFPSQVPPIVERSRLKRAVDNDQTNKSAKRLKPANPQDRTNTSGHDIGTALTISLEPRNFTAKTTRRMPSPIGDRNVISTGDGDATVTDAPQLNSVSKRAGAQLDQLNSKRIKIMHRPIEFEDISEEVEARMRRKKQRWNREAAEKPKRKFTQDVSDLNLGTGESEEDAHSPGDEGVELRKRQKINSPRHRQLRRKRALSQEEEIVPIVSKRKKG